MHVDCHSTALPCRRETLRPTDCTKLVSSTDRSLLEETNHCQRQQTCSKAKFNLLTQGTLVGEDEVDKRKERGRKREETVSEARS